MEVVIGLVILAILLGLYFLPTIIAVSRHKRSAAAIGALNFFLGWTLIGWIAALIWALAYDAPSDHQRRPHEPPAIQSSPVTPPYTEQPKQRRTTGFSVKWTIAGIVGVFFIGMLVLAGITAEPPSEGTPSSTPTRVSKSAVQSTATPIPSNTPTPVPTPTPPPRMSARQLLEERGANATRFDATLKGKWVTVFGQIENIDNSIVYLKGDGFLSSVHLRHIPKEDQIPLNVGQEYSATCKVGDYVLGSMDMNSCRPAGDGDAEPATSTLIQTIPSNTPTPVSEITPDSTPTPSPTLTPTPTISSPADLVEQVKDGVVRVNAGFSSGSGFIFDIEETTAFVATNHHVIENALGMVDVTVSNSHTYEALVLGWDADRDVAVLAICCSDSFTALSWDEELPNVGVDVVAVGYPRGGSDSHVTATTGEVASHDDLSRRLDLIPHTAPLNPGNSGGPLFSIPDARVVGINTSRGVTTLSFYAVPLQAIEEQIIKWRSQLVVTR